MRRASFFIRILLCVAAIAVNTLSNATAYAAPIAARPGAVINPDLMPARVARTNNVRVTLSDVPDDMIPNSSNTWKCDCSTSGCWPGCFTIASASIMKYWSLKGYPTLYTGDEKSVLARLRQLFPNILCYGNGDASGKPSDVGYDAFDVATGLAQYARENGYVFATKAIPEPTFEQVVAEIDAGRPVIGAFGESPWGSHAATIIGYDMTSGRNIMIVRPNLWKKIDMDLEWGIGYRGFGIVTVTPPYPTNAPEGAGVDARFAATATMQVTYETIVSPVDAEFTAHGNWQEAPGIGMTGHARTLATTDPSNLGPSEDTGWATWSPDLPFDGVWEALAWMPVRDTDDSASHSVMYRVNNAEGMNLVRRSQHDATQGWISLGTFPFTQHSGKASVTLGNLTGDYPVRKVWADVVKFVWRAPLIVRGEQDDAPLFLVLNGKRIRLPDQETFDALRLSKSNIRKLSDMALAQYPDGGMLPSLFSGWIGQYFNNTDLVQPMAVVRADARINFGSDAQGDTRANPAASAPWAIGTPALQPLSGFSVRWSRRMAFTDGHYPFILNAAGKARLFVDGEQVMSNWNANNPGIYIQQSSMVTLTSGLHLVEIEYANTEGDARIALESLPPNVPVIATSPVMTWTNIPSLTVGWLDSGAPEGNRLPRKFYVTAWRESDLYSISSDWITQTYWTVPLQGDGHYYWRVSAGNGAAVSDWSPAQEVYVDHSAPWAQMVSAGNQPSEEPHLSSTVEGQAVPATVVIDASGAPQVASVATAAPASMTHALGIKITWWATDTVSGIASVDLQARELIHAATIYTPAVEMMTTTQIVYELVISGAQQITNAIVIEAVVPYTTVAPLMVYTPLTASEWITVAQGVAGDHWIFIGVPGSTYEFRVRAHDVAGNLQNWYDGYSVQAQMNPDIDIRRTFIPVAAR